MRVRSYSSLVYGETVATRIRHDQAICQLEKELNTERDDFDRPFNFERKDIDKAFNQIDSLIDMQKIAIQKEYLRLKLREFHLKFEFEMKIHPEKEEQ